MLYFDANSIGPMPADAPQRVARLLDEGWRIARRRGWNDADWLAQPRTLGAAIAPLIGAGVDDVLIADSTSVNQYKMLRYALAVAAPRRAMLIERDVFPSNRYVAEGIAHSGAAELRLFDGEPALRQALSAADVAVVAFSHVDYRSSERLELARLTALAHEHGAQVLWDLSHSVGAVQIDLLAADADFAVGCGYKYLSGGPGAPAFVFCHPRWQSHAWPGICGWMGHADTFAFEPGYRPAPGIARHEIGTPQVIANTVFAAAADIWREVSPGVLDAQHRLLTDTLIALLDEHCAGAGLAVISPRRHALRGGHVALRFEHAGALAQALVEAGVVVSARKPDVLRFGVHPIATTLGDLRDAVQRLADILRTERWREPRFSAAAV